MWRKMMGVILAVACVGLVANVADAAAVKKHHGKAGAPKAHKATMEEMIRKAVDEAIKDSLPAAGGKYEFAAKRMRPPKNKKWTGRWNEMGQQGWQLVGSNENIYIFQRPGAVDLAAAGAKKTDKAAVTDTKKAQEKADKEAKKAAKEAEKTVKKSSQKATKSK